MTNARLALLLASCLVIACSPDLPIPRGEGGASPDLEMFLEPEGAEPNAAPLVVHLRLAGPAALETDPSQVVLAQGSLTERNLVDVSEGFVTDALARRLVQATVFAKGGDLVVIPHVALEPHENYSLGVASQGVSFPLRTAVPSSPPLVRRWPLEADPSSGHLFFCGDNSLADGAWPASLDPAGIVGTFYVGAPSGRARKCLRFDPTAGQTLEGFGHPPAAVNGRSLSPARVDFGPAPQDGGRIVSCVASERMIAFGCLTVEDDRVIVRSRVDALWVVGLDGVEDTIAVAGAGSRFLVRGLTPSSVAALRVETLTSSGWAEEDVTVHTAAGRGRPVLNEVYADAVGPEPAQEWIEIVNDGTRAVELRGLAIEDVGGHTVLPEDAPELSPGEYVIIAPAALDASGLYDVALGPDVTIIRVEKLGKNGLSNSGEIVRLVDPTGAVISAFPARKYKVGESVSRQTPWALDDDPSAFSLTPPTPGFENAPGPTGAQSL